MYIHMYDVLLSQFDISSLSILSQVLGTITRATNEQAGTSASLGRAGGFLVHSLIMDELKPRSDKSFEILFVSLCTSVTSDTKAEGLFGNIAFGFNKYNFVSLALSAVSRSLLCGILCAVYYVTPGVLNWCQIVGLVRYWLVARGIMFHKYISEKSVFVFDLIKFCNIFPFILWAYPGYEIVCHKGYIFCSKDILFYNNNSWSYMHWIVQWSLELCKILKLL